MVPAVFFFIFRNLTVIFSNAVIGTFCFLFLLRSHYKHVRYTYLKHEIQQLVKNWAIPSSWNERITYNSCNPNSDKGLVRSIVEFLNDSQTSGPENSNLNIFSKNYTKTPFLEIRSCCFWESPQNVNSDFLKIY